MKAAALLLGVLLACTSERPADVAPPVSGASAAAAVSTPTCGTPVIEGNGIGAVRIGVPADSVHARCTVVRDTVKRRTEGQRERILVVAFGGDTVNAEIDSGKVWRLEVMQPGLRTADSLGVGTPLARLLGLPAVQGLTGEGNLFVVTPARCGLSFELSGPRSPAGDWPAERLRELPESIVVRRVLVIGCRPA
jgi:hypothetical protein